MLDPTRPGFVGRCVLAPMVRTGELPTRLLSLKYGADAVWSPEIVDKAIIGSKRIENELAGCIDFVKATNGGRGEERIIFRTHTAAEKAQQKLIFQIGTSDAELAVEAAKLVADDVAGIDVNAGCPKHFSIHSGMGAALLKSPDKLAGILEALVNEVGRPTNTPISVKIRILHTKEETLELVRKLCATGIVRVTVHCRTTPMRPREPALREMLAEIAAVCHEAGVQCYANGDVKSREHADQLINEYGVDGCMIARAAENNPSVFRPEGALPWREVADEYLRIAVSIGHYLANTKFVLSQIVNGKDEMYQRITQLKTVRAICGVMGVPYNPPTGLEEVEPPAKPVKPPKTAAVQKAQKGSNTAKAAGSTSQNSQKQKNGKKLSERGVTVAQAAAISRPAGGQTPPAVVL